MNLIITSIVILIVSQSIKLIIRLVRGDELSRSLLSWIYLWTGEFPSSHSAILTGILYTIGNKEGFGSFFYFALIISGFIMYGLLEDKKRQTLFRGYFRKSDDKAIQKIVSDKKILQFSGHTFIEVVAGIALGLTISVLMNKFIF